MFKIMIRKQNVMQWKYNDKMFQKLKSELAKNKIDFCRKKDLIIFNIEIVHNNNQINCVYSTKINIVNA